MIYFIVLLLLAILVSLVFAVYYLVKGKSQKKMLHSLVWRVGLSMLLVLLLSLGSYLGFLKPNTPSFLQTSSLETS